MTERQGDHELFLAQDVTAHRWVVKTYASEPDIDPAVLEGGDLFKTCHLDEADIDPRRFRAETPDQVRQGRVDGRGNEADDVARPFRLAKAPHHGAQVVNALKN